MDELTLLEDFLSRALERSIISPVQKRFYMFKYKQGEWTLSQIQEEIARLTREPAKSNVYDVYVLKTCLGRGGMGEIFEAQHRETGELFALKKIKASYGQTPENQEQIRKRFLRECRLQSQMHHPHIVTVYDYGSYENELFLVTKLIRGETLLEMVERERHQPEYFTDLALQLLAQMKYICEAVDYAHKQGIVHRDINPRNIMLDAQQIWIMDFGLAKNFNIDITKLTKSTELIGTPSYMAPEQWNNQDIGPWSDIYSIGMTLYYIATARHPYPEDPMTVASNIINQIAPVPVREYNKAIPEAIEDIIHKAISFHPMERYLDAQNLGKEIVQNLKKLKAKSLSQKFLKLLDPFQKS